MPEEGWRRVVSLSPEGRTKGCFLRYDRPGLVKGGLLSEDIVEDWMAGMGVESFFSVTYAGFLGLGMASFAVRSRSRVWK